MMITTLLAAASLTAGDGYRDACTDGTFEAWTRQPDAAGEMQENHNRSNLICRYDGQADIAEWRTLDAALQPVFHGVSITIWNADRTQGRTLWATPAYDMINDIRQSWEGDALVASSEGHDPNGIFLERHHSTFTLGGDQHFSLDRSRDGGETWTRFNEIAYLRSNSQTPDLASGWAPPLAEIGPAHIQPDSFLMLDGYAAGRFIENEQGNPTGFVFQTITVLPGGRWAWRVVEWSYEDGLINTIDTPL